MDANEPNQFKPFPKAKRVVKQVAKLVLLLLVLYPMILLLGLIPVNNNFTPVANGVEIYLISNAVHADIIVPKANDVFDWNKKFQPADFAGDISSKTHIAFGWGDRGFFLETETWDDLKLR